MGSSDASKRKTGGASSDTPSKKKRRSERGEDAGDHPAEDVNDPVEDAPEEPASHDNPSPPAAPQQVIKPKMPPFKFRARKDPGDAAVKNSKSGIEVTLLATKVEDKKEGKVNFYVNGVISELPTLEGPVTQTLKGQTIAVITPNEDGSLDVECPIYRSVEGNLVPVGGKSMHLTLRIGTVISVTSFGSSYPGYTGHLKLGLVMKALMTAKSSTKQGEAQRVNTRINFNTDSIQKQKTNSMSPFAFQAAINKLVLDVPPNYTPMHPKEVSTNWLSFLLRLGKDVVAPAIPAGDDVVKNPGEFIPTGQICTSIWKRPIEEHTIGKQEWDKQTLKVRSVEMASEVVFLGPDEKVCRCLVVVAPPNALTFNAPLLSTGLPPIKGFISTFIENLEHMSCVASVSYTDDTEMVADPPYDKKLQVGLRALFVNFGSLGPWSKTVPVEFMKQILTDRTSKVLFFDQAPFKDAPFKDAKNLYGVEPSARGQLEEILKIQPGAFLNCFPWGDVERVCADLNKRGYEVSFGFLFPPETIAESVEMEGGGELDSIDKLVELKGFPTNPKEFLGWLEKDVMKMDRESDRDRDSLPIPYMSVRGKNGETVESVISKETTKYARFLPISLLGDTVSGQGEGGDGQEGDDSVLQDQ